MRQVSQSRNFANMRTAPNPDDLLTVGQVAEELDKPPRTIHYWISTGRLTATKIGTGRTSAYVISRVEVDRLKAEAAA